MKSMPKNDLKEKNLLNEREKKINIEVKKKSY